MRERSPIKIWMLKRPKDQAEFEAFNRKIVNINGVIDNDIQAAEYLCVFGVVLIVLIS